MSDRPETTDVDPVESETADPVATEPSVDSFDLETLGWRRTYERSAIEKFALDIEAERDRLEAAIDDAEQRIEEAQSALDERRAAMEQSISELMGAARQELDRLEAERDAAVAAIHAEAEREAERLLDAARRAAASVEEARRALRPDPELNGVGDIAPSGPGDTEPTDAH
jgi:flagellar biosynthesis chaperone FliJ